MEEKRYRCSVNPELINKNESGDKRKLAEGFENESPTCEELMLAVYHGMAISYQYHGGQRKTENFICTDIALVDIDEIGRAHV